MDANGTCEAEHAFEISGTVDGAMSSVSGIVSGGNGDVNLAEGAAHVRIVTISDKNGIPINGLDVDSAQIEVKDTSEADGDHLVFAFAKNADDAHAAAELREADAVEGDDNVDPPVEAVFAAANPQDAAVSSGKDGAYPLGISASDDKVGTHSFSVTIGIGHAKAKKTADADGNPLDAHIGLRHQGSGGHERDQPGRRRTAVRRRRHPVGRRRVASRLLNDRRSPPPAVTGAPRSMPKRSCP